MHLKVKPAESQILNATSTDWLVVFVTINVLYVSLRTIYHLYFNPLAKYPGPFLAKISSLPSFYHACKGDRHIWLWQCFQIYGSKIRTTPNTVLFNSPKAYQDIYNIKANVKKNKTYDAWRRNEEDINTLNVTNVAVHAYKRRLLNTVFTDSSVRSAASFIIRHLDRWNELSLNQETPGDWSKSIDMAKWMDCMVFDVMTDLCFGKSANIKEPGHNPYKTIPEAVISYMQFMHPVRPRGLNYLLDKITPPDIKRYYEFLESSVSERIELERSLEQAGQKQGKELRKDMLYYLYRATDPETGRPAYPKNELLAETSLLIIAGSDTTSVSLCGFFFYITHYPRVYKKLVEHIRSTFSSVDEISEGSKLTSCHYLRACIDEAMRLTPAGPSELSRTILHGGLQVDGEYFPEGANVGTAGWSNGHNDDNYGGDSEVFRPERWIVDPENGNTAEQVAHIKSCFHPFSSGPGNCAGQNLAKLEMMLVTARTLYRMDIRIAPGSTLGEGRPELGWGRRNRNSFQLEDAYVAIRHGPMLQFRQREE
ncbi:uncharacterized protein KY384_003586 [Bacidia gigantensis]|uniref:uncharacterized protein n=1 Tax=Bacidia gigantensis TaxID=2732470 RepID=UPI001D03661C|nr:uncharacterized protein KY384_003586 [Bacidia gigantensis]KAG8531950.1 hypothetical protein KY384_003586 [Bacidia gigantensis]